MIELFDQIICNPKAIEPESINPVQYKTIYNWPAIIGIVIIAMSVEVGYLYNVLCRKNNKFRLLITLYALNIVTVIPTNYLALKFDFWCEILPFSIEGIILYIFFGTETKNGIVKIYLHSWFGNFLSMIAAIWLIIILSHFGIIICKTSAVDVV